MFMSPWQNALQFTISSLFNIYIMIVSFRWLLQLASARMSSPLAQVAFKATNPILVPLNKIIPSFRSMNFAALFLAIILQSLELYLLTMVKGFSIIFTPSSIAGLLLWASGEILDLLLLFFLVGIIIQVIVSWIQPHTYNPILATIERITDLILVPVRRILPNFGALDFSPLVVVFLISLLRILVADPIIFFAKSLI